MAERPAAEGQRSDVVVFDVRVSTERGPDGRPPRHRGLRTSRHRGLRTSRRRGLRTSRHRGLRASRRRGLRTAATGGLVGLVAAGLIVLAIAGRPRPAPVRTVRPPASARLPGAAGVAAAYGEPARCLIVTIAPAFPAYARADFNRARPCGRYTGDPTAIFVRAAGVWRTVIDATTYSCPVADMPAGAQRELGICAIGAEWSLSGQPIQ